MRDPKNVITPERAPYFQPTTPAFQNPSTKTWRAGVSGWQAPHESRCLPDEGKLTILKCIFFFVISTDFAHECFFLLEDCKYPIFKCLFLRWRISNNWMVPANYKSLKLAQPLKLYSSSTLTEENTLVFTNSRLVSIHVWTNKIRTSSFMGKTSIAISVFGTVLSLSLYIYTV